jgi:hypothetical protein
LPKWIQEHLKDCMINLSPEEAVQISSHSQERTRGVPVDQGSAGDQGDAGEDPAEGAAGLTFDKTAFIKPNSFRSCNLALFQKTKIILFHNASNCRSMLQGHSMDVKQVSVRPSSQPAEDGRMWYQHEDNSHSVRKIYKLLRTHRSNLTATQRM